MVAGMCGKRYVFLFFFAVSLFRSVVAECVRQIIVFLLSTFFLSLGDP